GDVPRIISSVPTHVGDDVLADRGHGRLFDRLSQIRSSSPTIERIPSIVLIWQVGHPSSSHFAQPRSDCPADRLTDHPWASGRPGRRGKWRERQRNTEEVWCVTRTYCKSTPIT
ncbi:unnamed protein product, partial [Nesidiocoris tenuis]